MILSISVEKAFDKTFMIKTLRKIGIEENFKLT